ncbi:uncharacterized protein LOC144437069 [Glandiceps talaboti]
MKSFMVLGVLCMSTLLVGVKNIQALPNTDDYIGCYEDTEDVGLCDDNFEDQDGLTIENCIQYCQDRGHPHAALYFGNQCWCGELSSQSSTAPSSECDTPCPGNANQKCGGRFALSVYKIGTSLGCENSLELTSTSTDVAVETDVPQLDQMTMCIWAKAVDNPAKGTLMSYAVQGCHNEILVYGSVDIEIYIHNDKKVTSLSINDGNWHLMCATWCSSGGNWALYDNGVKSGSGSGLKNGYKVIAGGTITLGQEQDSVRGSYDPNQAFKGFIAYFSMWSKALSATEIDGIDCSSIGDVFSWDVNGLDIKGDVDIVCTETCGVDCTKVCGTSLGCENSLELTSTSTDVAVETDVPQLDQMTMCIWAKAVDNPAKGTLMSYAVQGCHNEILVYGSVDIAIYIHNDKRVTSLSINDGNWHLMCATWCSSGGNWALYDNGVKSGSGSGLKNGYKVIAGGTITLGQEQDSVRGSYDPNQAFKGFIAYFSMWSKALSATEIDGIDCSSIGDVFSWDVNGLDIKGDVDIVCTETCGVDCTKVCGTSLGCENSLELTSTSTDVAVETDVPQLDQMTMCIWAKAVDNPAKGTLMSYAVQGCHNEILVYGSVDIEIYIHNDKKVTSLSINDGNWHLMCATWCSSGGNWALYDNGVKSGSGSGLKNGYKVIAGGTITLGQEQDSVRGSYDPNQAFKGFIAYFSMWSKALSATEIDGIDCSSIGDVFSWDVNGLDIKGDVDIVCTETCGVDCTKVCGTSLGCENSLELTSTSTDVAVETDVPQLDQMTMCIWAKAVDNPAKGTLMSYAVQGCHNEILVYGSVDIEIYIHNDKKVTSLSINDGNWHLMCATWCSSGGNWALYDNGVKSGSGSGLKNGYKVIAGGTITLGQEQDSVRGSYDPNQAFKGFIAYFSMWSKALSATEIDGIDCSSIGDVFSWDVNGLDIKGDVDIVCTETCGVDCTKVCGTSLGCENSLELTSTSTDVAVETDVPQLDQMTMCIWAKAVDNPTKGTLMSYAVQGCHNEILVYGSVDIEIYIHNDKKVTSLSINDGNWHLMCATWCSSGGNWALYDNGVKSGYGSGLKNGYKVIAGGTITLGQEQDSVRGSYDPNQAFKGFIAYFSMWSKALSATEIDGIDCSSIGDVFSWDVNGLDIKGDVDIVCTETCGVDCKKVCGKK